MLFSKHDIKCDVAHVVFLDDYKTIQNRKARYKKHITIHTKQRINDFQIELEDYHNKLKK